MRKLSTRRLQLSSERLRTLGTSDLACAGGGADTRIQCKMDLTVETCGTTLDPDLCVESWAGNCATAKSCVGC